MKLLALLVATLASFALCSPRALAPRTVPATMSITHFTRNCTDPTPCVYSLTIETAGGQLTTPGSQNCTVVDSDAKARTHSWYGVKCKENENWDLSWGWDYQGDFTVLTVAQREVLYEAFFGYDHPNAQAVVGFKDQGPNAVKYL